MARSLIISPVADSRRALLRMLTSNAEFHETYGVNEIESAATYLQSNQKLNLIFISSAYGEQNVASFIETARDARACADCAYVLLLNQGERKTTAIANHMMIGIHAFLSEPYTFENVDSTARLAQAVRLQSSGDRMKAATGLLLTEILEGSPMPPEFAADGKGNMWERVQESCRKYQELTGNSVGGTVIKEIAPLAPSKRLSEIKGMSKRVKGMFESKLKEHVQTLKKGQRPG